MQNLQPYAFSAFFNATQTSTEVRLGRSLDAMNPIIVNQDETLKNDWLNMPKSACAMTLPENINMWEGSLKDMYYVSQVELLHPNEKGDFLNGAMVFVDQKYCGKAEATQPGSWSVFKCDKPIKGSKILVQKSHMLGGTKRYAEPLGFCGIKTKGVYSGPDDNTLQSELVTQLSQKVGALMVQNDELIKKVDFIAKENEKELVYMKQHWGKYHEPTGAFGLSSGVAIVALMSQLY